MRFLLGYDVGMTSFIRYVRSSWTFHHEDEDETANECWKMPAADCNFCAAFVANIIVQLTMIYWHNQQYLHVHKFSLEFLVAEVVSSLLDFYFVLNMQNRS